MVEDMTIQELKKLEDLEKRVTELEHHIEYLFSRVKLNASPKFGANLYTAGDIIKNMKETV